MKRVVYSLYALAAFACFGVVMAATAPAATHDPVPHCQTIVFEQASGTYAHKWCDIGLPKLPSGKDRVFAVSGGNIENRGVAVFGESPTNPVTADGYGPPGGPHWHCQEYGHLYSYDCISGYGFVYGGVWAYSRDFYQHPHPLSDYVINEPYFTQNGPNGMTNVPHYMRRVVIVNDGAVNALVEPVQWEASEFDLHPAPPKTCMVISGPRTGYKFPCTKRVTKSILDYWYQARVETDPW